MAFAMTDDELRQYVRLRDKRLLRLAGLVLVALGGGLVVVAVVKQDTLVALIACTVIALVGSLILLHVPSMAKSEFGRGIREHLINKTTIELAGSQVLFRYDDGTFEGFPVRDVGLDARVPGFFTLTCDGRLLAIVPSRAFPDKKSEDDFILALQPKALSV